MNPLGFISWTGAILFDALAPSLSLRDRTGAAGPYEATLPLLRMTDSLAPRPSPLAPRPSAEQRHDSIEDAIRDSRFRVATHVLPAAVAVEDGHGVVIGVEAD